jgi:magnesium-protoporphyrin O-methyltransferase
VFGDRFARRTAKRYRRRGLDPAERRIVDLLAEAGLDGATVLEIGGGVGQIQVELLARGAASATNLELSPAYDDEAERLVQERGMTGRVRRQQLDLAEQPTGVEPADVVVLHRVVCCYPDYQRLLSAAAGRARRHLVFSHPPRNLVSRAVVGLENAMLRLGRREFRTFAHPPEAMLAVLADSGLTVRATGRGGLWQIAALSR